MTLGPLPRDPLWRPASSAPAGLLRRYELPAATPAAQAWDLLYQEEPDLYDQLVEGEPLHPGLFRELPLEGATVLDIGAGSGRLTITCAALASQVLALEPASPMRDLLERKLHYRAISNVTILAGRAQAIPLPDRSVDVCVSASAFGAPANYGGEAGLDELRRVTRLGGEIFVLWPDDPEWFLERGFQYHAFGGSMELRFRDLDSAKRCATIFLPTAVLDHLSRTNRPVVPYELTGANPPRDLCRCRVV